MADEQFLRTILVLPVHNIEESVGWYCATLGFETRYVHEGEDEDEDEDEDEAANYAILQRESADLHLILDEPPPYEQPWTQAGTGYLYLIVRDVDAVYDELKSRGAKITRGLQTENWGARGFNLADPSGNAIHIEQSD